MAPLALKTKPQVAAAPPGAAPGGRAEPLALPPLQAVPPARGEAALLSLSSPPPPTAAVQLTTAAGRRAAQQWQPLLLQC